MCRTDYIVEGDLVLHSTTVITGISLGADVCRRGCTRLMLEANWNRCSASGRHLRTLPARAEI